MALVGLCTKVSSKPQIRAAAAKLRYGLSRPRTREEPKPLEPKIIRPQCGTMAKLAIDYDEFRRGETDAVFVFFSLLLFLLPLISHPPGSGGEGQLRVTSH
jgi:hypothetical protein